MPFIFLAIVFVAVLIGPGLWVRRVMSRHSQPIDRYAMTGAELARKLLDVHGLTKVSVESTEAGDHYDPGAKSVRLSQGNYSTRSLTAITVAAHEVGHALQDAEGYPPLRWRTRLIKALGPVERIGAGMLMAAPFLTIATRAPGIGLIALAGGLLTLGSGIVIHAVTLPTEFNASFARALPLLNACDIFRAGDHRKARSVLAAAAMTYVSASLMSILNIARWWAILRR